MLLQGPPVNHGVSDKRRVPCARSPDTHGHHPEDEACSYCCPKERSRSVYEDLQPPFEYDPEYLWGVQMAAQHNRLRALTPAEQATLQKWLETQYGPSPEWP